MNAPADRTVVVDAGDRESVPTVVALLQRRGIRDGKALACDGSPDRDPTVTSPATGSAGDRALGRDGIGARVFRGVVDRASAWAGSRPRAGALLVEAEVRRVLAKEGCPVCHLLAGGDRTFFSWYLYERYAEPEALDEVTRALGFCAAHGDYLLRATGARSQLATVHQVVAHRLRAAWSGDKGRSAWEEAFPRGDGPQWDRCPACSSRRDAAGRAASFISSFLLTNAVGGRYGEPGMLCLPHLRQMAPLLDDGSFERVLTATPLRLATCCRTC